MSNFQLHNSYWNKCCGWLLASVYWYATSLHNVSCKWFAGRTGHYVNDGTVDEAKEDGNHRCVGRWLTCTKRF